MNWLVLKLNKSINKLNLIIIILFQKPTETYPSTSKNSEETGVQEKEINSSGGTSSGVQQKPVGGSTNAAANKGEVSYAEPSPLAKLVKKLYE